MGCVLSKKSTQTPATATATETRGSKYEIPLFMQVERNLQEHCNTLWIKCREEIRDPIALDGKCRELDRRLYVAINDLYRSKMRESRHLTTFQELVMKDMDTIADIRSA